ncbi:MAG: FlaD/FlaE family flagellar protein [Euryarchaeota archaeon]|nr:FlaD/FlaE family flagellar protein [Euryarchaeota archaeon]
MVGLGNKLKGLKSKILRKGSTDDNTEGSPFEAQAPPFAGMPPQGGPSPFGGGEIDTPNPLSSPGTAPSGPPGFGAPAPAQEEPETNQMGEANAKKIKELDNRLSKIDVNISMVQRENKDVKETVEKIDQSVLELLSLYEIVSNQVNPFVGDGESGRDTIERFDKNEKRLTEITDVMTMMKNDLDAFGQQLETPGVATETKDHIREINTKIEAFADAMVSLHDNIDALSSRVGEMETNVVELAETTNNISSRVEEMETVDPTTTNKEVQPVRGVTQEEPIRAGQYEERNDDHAPMLGLSSIKKNPMKVIILLNWIEFLMERVGRNNLVDALDYYVDIGWISEEVQSEIMTYARGIDYYVEKPTWRLLPEDHTKSLLFIEKLCGRKIDRNMLSSIDREMSKVKHGLEELYGI